MLSLLCAALVAASPAPSGAHPLRHNLPVDVATTVALGGYWVSSELLFKDSLAPAECRLCDRDAAGNDRRLSLDLLGTQLKVADPYVPGVARASDVIAYAALPLAVVGTHAFAANDNESLRALPLDLLIVAQAVTAAASLNQTVKFIAGRARPFVFRLGQDSALSQRDPYDNNLSFYSAHASFGFSLVAATATVAELRGYRLAKWVWVVGLPLAAALPVLRMMADKHYFTDVLVGSAVGTAFGVLMPRTFHGRVGDVELALSAGPGGAAVSGAF